MFDVIFSGIQAYQQVGMFIGALICLGIGGLLLGSCFYWRVHALHATGTIIGVITKGAMYTPVYRYTLPDGQTHEAQSDTSSGSTSGYQTGRVVPLLISAHNPTEAHEANSYLLEIIGAVFLVPGVWLGYTAFTAYPITRMTWFMAAAMVIYLVERGRRIFIPKGQRISIEEWKRQHGMGQASIDFSAVKPVEQISGPSGAQQKQQRSQQKRWAPVLGLFAVVLAAVGVLQGMRTAQLESAGLRAEGEVVDLKAEYSSGSAGHYNYYPIVRYRTEAGAETEFKDSVGSNPPAHRPGDKVRVLYLADRPASDAIIDRGAFFNWMIPALLLVGACVLAWLTFAMLRGFQKQPA